MKGHVHGHFVYGTKNLEQYIVLVFLKPLGFVSVEKYFTYWFWQGQGEFLWQMRLKSERISFSLLKQLNLNCIRYFKMIFFSKKPFSKPLFFCMFFVILVWKLGKKGEIRLSRFKAPQKLKNFVCSQQMLTQKCHFLSSRSSAKIEQDF